VAKGLTPVHGHFVLSALLPPPVKEAAKVVEPTVAAPQKTAAAVKEPRKSKKEDSAGLSPAERSELEELKKSIIERKAQLAAEGKSGGQQNKDEQVVSWVKRMTELKEKDQPGSTQKDAGKKSATKKTKAPLSQEEQKHMDALQGKIEAYRLQLQKEHGYSKKEIKADPDIQDMEAELAALEKRSN
jgi:hypothetical protein